MTSTNRRRIALGLAALVGAVLALLVPAHSAGAHSDDGRMTITKLEQVGPSEVRVEVGIVYANDGEPAEGATVTAVLTGPAGDALDPVELPRSSGALYAAELAVPTPGGWTVAVTSTTPVASASGVVEVTPSSPGSTPASVVSSSVSAAPAAADQASADSESSDDSGFPIWIVIVVIAVAGVAGVVLVARNRNTGARES